MVIPSTQAQLVTYNFTATRTTDFGGTTDFDEQISGQVTLDLGAIASVDNPGDWRTGSFAVTSLSDNAYSTGTNSGPMLETIFQNTDDVQSANVNTSLTWPGLDSVAFKQIIVSTNSGVSGDGIPSIPNLWAVIASRDK